VEFFFSANLATLCTALENSFFSIEIFIRLLLVVLVVLIEQKEHIIIVFFSFQQSYNLLINLCNASYK
jgi:hypothetical protein